MKRKIFKVVDELVLPGEGRHCLPAWGNQPEACIYSGRNAVEKRTRFRLNKGGQEHSFFRCCTGNWTALHVLKRMPRLNVSLEVISRISLSVLGIGMEKNMEGALLQVPARKKGRGVLQQVPSFPDLTAQAKREGKLDPSFGREEGWQMMQVQLCVEGTKNNPHTVSRGW